MPRVVVPPPAIPDPPADTQPEGLAVYGHVRVPVKNLDLSWILDPHAPVPDEERVDTVASQEETD